MVPTTSNWTRVTARKVAMAALLAVAVSLVGCGGSDENAAAIRQAKIDMQTLAASAQSGRASYDKIIASLSKAAESKESGEASAARLIRAQAYVRQGEAGAAQAAAAERDAQRVAQSVRSAHDRWHNLQAQASALEKYDPKADIAKIDEQIAARDAEIAQARADLGKAEQELAALRQQTQEAQGQSQAKRDAEMKIRGQMLDKSQVERAELVKKANEAKREGDAFDLKAADLLAQMGRQQPVIAELQTRLQRLDAQKLMLNASKQNAVAATEQSRQQAARTREGVVTGGKVETVGAKQVGEELESAAKELNDARAKLTAPTDEAMGFYEKALSEVSRAKSGGGGGPAGKSGGDTRLIEASVHHARADLFMARGSGLASHAALMKLLGTSEPKVANASAYAAAAKEASESAAKMMESAKEEFTKARELYDAAGSSQKAADVKARLEEISKALVSLGASRGDADPAGAGTETAQVPPAGQTPPAGEQTPPSAPANFEGEQAAIATLMQKVGEVMTKRQYDALPPHLVFRNAKQEEDFRKVTPLMAKQEALDAACRERFGQSFSDLITEMGADLRDNPTLSGEQELLRLQNLDVNDLEITVLPSGTDAEVRFKSARTAAPIEAMKVGGEWKIKMDFELGGGAAGESYIQLIGKAIDAVTENVKAGKYGTDAQKMVKDLAAEVAKAMLEMIKPSGDQNK